MQPSNLIIIWLCAGSPTALPRLSQGLLAGKSTKRERAQCE